MGGNKSKTILFKGIIQEKYVLTFILTRKEKIKMEELYDFLIKLEEDTLKIDEKRIEELFGELNDEQNNFISELRYKYFKLGFEIKGVLENFKNER